MRQNEPKNRLRDRFRERFREMFRNTFKSGFTRDTFIRALRIAIGSGTAIFAASALHLEFAASAGMVTLLTILTTRWETLKLSAARIGTFAMAVVLCRIVFVQGLDDGAAFAVFVFFLIILSDWIGWRVTASVNAVIGTHFLSTRDFSISFILNEFLILMIGILIAVIVNLFQHNGRQRERIVSGIRDVEADFREVLEKLACDLSDRYQIPEKDEQLRDSVWARLDRLEQRLEEYQERARIYQYNTFQSHTSYYSRYFEMRSRQCETLKSLHSELEKIRKMPGQAKIIAGFIRYLVEHVTEMNDPDKQLRRLKELFEDMEQQELPRTREEFEGRAVLYHILMDLEEFLQFKRQFVECIDDTQFQIYWKKAVEKRSSSSNA